MLLYFHINSKVSTRESTLELFTLADKSPNFSKTISFQVSCERVSLLTLTLLRFVYFPRNIISDVNGITP